MTFAFARVCTMIAVRAADYFANGRHWGVRLHEKGGKRHETPAHHKTRTLLDEHIRTAGIGDEGKNFPLPFVRRLHWHTHRRSGEPCRRAWHDPAPPTSWG
jgi:hypothetical protein